MNGADSDMQLLEPTDQTEQAARLRFGDPKGRVNEDPGAGKRAPGVRVKLARNLSDKA